MDELLTLGTYYSRSPYHFAANDVGEQAEKQLAHNSPPDGGTGHHGFFARCLAVAVLHEHQHQVHHKQIVRVGKESGTGDEDVLEMLGGHLVRVEQLLDTGVEVALAGGVLSALGLELAVNVHLQGRDCEMCVEYDGAFGAGYW